MQFLSSLISPSVILALLIVSSAILLLRLFIGDSRRIEQTILVLFGVQTLLPLAATVVTSTPISLTYLYLDRLSLVMLSFISFIGLIVTRYSIRYLAGEKRQKEFMFWLHGAILSAQLLVTSGNLLLLVIAWVLVSLTLHQLLSYYSERPRAVLAARKKFLISRLGDLAMLFSLALIYLNFHTLQIEELFMFVNAGLSDSQKYALQLSCLGFVLAACCKSAQVPFHSWLPDTLECPTPVSALMHAGIVNGGGYLLIRLSPLFANATLALNILVLVGTLTAVFGVLTMWAQTSVKKSLAWSTVGQMGFMMIQCGLGAYTLAIAHIIGHGCYKANAFLMSGSLEKFILPTVMPRKIGSLVGIFIIGLVFSITVLYAEFSVVGFSLQGAHFGQWPGGLPLAILLVFALTQALVIGSQSLSNRIFIRGALLIMVASIAIGVEIFFQRVFAGSIGNVPLIWERGVLGQMLAVFTVVTFLGLSLLSILLPSLREVAFFNRFRVHAINGFYLGIYADRLTLAFFEAASWEKRANGGE